MFALIFVAAVGLGPFAGVLGIALHRAGSIAGLWAEAIETTDMGPVEAARMSGAGRLKVFVQVQLPDALPQLSSILLNMWEFNVRASTMLGVVGAGGIGQELTNSVNLLLFDRVLTILVIILVMVTLIDQLSAWLRRRLSWRLFCRYRGFPGDFEALREASLEVSAGEFVAVPGPSGSGKSTLFRCISRLTEPDSGSILIEGVLFGGVAGASLRKARGGIGVVFQQFNHVRRRSAPANVLTSVLPSIPVWRIAMGA